MQKIVEVQIQECKIAAESLSQHAKAMQGDSARKQKINGHYIIGFVIMPNHVHAFLPRRVSSATVCAKGGTLRSRDNAKRIEVQIQDVK